MNFRTPFDRLVSIPPAFKPLVCTCGRCIDINDICTGPVREMVLADIVSPWVWAYSGHVLPNGLVFVDPYNDLPIWKSNATEWHGI